jgi:hypothetical protein
MSRLIPRLLFGALGLMVLVGCPGAPPQEETEKEPNEDRVVVEESFEGGDSGALTLGSEELTESEEEPQDDS